MSTSDNKVKTSKFARAAACFSDFDQQMNKLVSKQDTIAEACLRYAAERCSKIINILKPKGLTSGRFNPYSTGIGLMNSLQSRL